MESLSERVSGYIDRYAMFRAGQRVGVAVSGGADSICLLYLLREIAPRWNLHLSVVHIEHGIRGEASRADAALVRRTAAELGFVLHFLSGDTPAIPDNLEQAARRMRHSFYSQLIASGEIG